MAEAAIDRLVKVPAPGVLLEGQLILPAAAEGLVLFAHGSGSSRHSPRNSFVARTLQGAGLGTLLMDLLTRTEDAVYETRFDIDLLTDRLEAATRWLQAEPATGSLRLGYFGSSTGAAAALRAAADLGSAIGAVVSRGGRPDLAGPLTGRVQAPTLLIVGGQDGEVLELNWKAYDELTADRRLTIVPGATHLFEEPGALDEVARLAADWFTRYLAAPREA
jgi:putative phosphoribosyl transferase